MAFVSEQRSALNPNAPLFVPAAFRQVEDFSPKWWDLVKTSTWFQGYWISQHEDDDFGGNVENATKKEAVNMLPETFDFGMEDDFPSLDAEFEELVFSSGAEYFINPLDCDPVNAFRTQIGVNKDSKALLKNLATRKSPVEPPKYHEKPAQHVAVRCGLQRIQQPR